MVIQREAEIQRILRGMPDLASFIRDTVEWTREDYEYALRRVEIDTMEEARARVRQWVLDGRESRVEAERAEQALAESRQATAAARESVRVGRQTYWLTIVVLAVSVVGVVFAGMALWR